MVIALVLLVTAQAAAAQASEIDPAVKMSRSGICHERGTVHYRQTIYFESFPSLEACLAAGGRPMGGALTAAAPIYDYRGTHPPRNYWPHAIVVAAVVLVAGFLLRGRWRAWRTHREFEDRGKRRWEGHKLGPRKPPKL